MCRFSILLFSSFMILFVEGRQRWHTSQLRLMRLYDLQKEHFNVFNDYLNSETDRLGELKKKFSEIYEWRDGKITKNNTHFHVNSLNVMTRIHYDFQKIEHLMCNKHSLKALKKIDQHKDLSGDHMLLACGGLRRLQRFYEIPAFEMAAGKFNDRIIGNQLDARECYFMTEYCFVMNDMFGSIDWGIQSYNKWAIGGGQSKCFNVEVLKYYIILSSMSTGFNYTTQFESSETQNYSSGIIEKIAQHSFLMGDDIFYINNNVKSLIDIFGVYHTLDTDNRRIDFKRLCKHGETMRTLTKDSKCRYQTKNCAYRLLMPFKEEDLDNDPYIKIYHDVLYDDEIEKMKALISNEMIDSTVVHHKISASVVVEENRSGQTGRLSKDDASKHFDKLNTRIETITGMGTKNAELYQIVNYGLGGHFTPHHDAFIKKQGDVSIPYGNRITTVLFYMTGVHNDGYTVFPMLNIVSPAEKGAALVWHNLHHSTDGHIHEHTLHGSCPLLTGNKWIVTRWLYEADQNLPYSWKDNLLKNNYY
ncbi:Prolyl 4-hydroxylase, alpha subunit,Oxoglutarate/iron-dependent dioxygenase,Prolyl 4- [Cinara cedri]|uniref:procollagen-proline 4-dioxygenase n=1 Tax=Cinara cedri TaxID=506608 RepID=A0A5E4MN88_9HEMI|nr:Prolyl 4-hydroxylase, alpha subunit,Oxoglutarate/iron-dependent dioxygenase,Prolyl 4- [Cinara cedri]